MLVECFIVIKMDFVVVKPFSVSLSKDVFWCIEGGFLWH